MLFNEFDKTMIYLQDLQELLVTDSLYGSYKRPQTFIIHYDMMLFEGKSGAFVPQHQAA